jgi:hypothetical protein
MILAAWYSVFTRKEQMNFTKQILFSLDDWHDNYWLHRAEEEILAEWGVRPWHMDSLRFQTLEAAQNAAIQILRRLAELTPHCNSPTFESHEDQRVAKDQLGGRAIVNPPTAEGRWVGDPTFTILEGVNVEMVRPLEVRLVAKGTTIKTVTVDGETYTKEVPDDRHSEWFKGDPERIRLGISECVLLVAG